MTFFMFTLVQDKKCQKFWIYDHIVRLKMNEDVGDRDPLPADENEKVDDQHAKFGCNLITRANIQDIAIFKLNMYLPQ